MNFISPKILNTKEFAQELWNTPNNLYQSYIDIHGEFISDPLKCIQKINPIEKTDREILLGYIAILWKIVHTYGLNICFDGLNLYVEYYDFLCEKYKEMTKPVVTSAISSPLPPPPPSPKDLWNIQFRNEELNNKNIDAINRKRVGTGKQLVPLFYGASFCSAMCRMFRQPSEGFPGPPTEIPYNINTFKLETQWMMSWNPDTYCEMGSAPSGFFLEKKEIIPILKERDVEISRVIYKPVQLNRANEFEEFYLKPLKTMFPEMAEVIRKIFLIPELMYAIPLIHRFKDVWNIVKDFIDYYVHEEQMTKKCKEEKNVTKIKSYHLDLLKTHPIKKNWDKYLLTMRNYCKIGECPFTGAVYNFFFANVIESTTDNKSKGGRRKQVVENVKSPAPFRLLPEHFL